MLLIYSPEITARLEYIISLIFERVIKTEYKLTSDLTFFKGHTRPKINYSNIIVDDAFNLFPFGILKSQKIESQHIDIFKTELFTAFFKTPQSDYSFDIFSATFYLVSRYEEYLPNPKDFYGRFPHTASLSFRENFLDLPLVNIWLKHFKKVLNKKFEKLIFNTPAFEFLPTYDIDIAWSFKNKGPIRNIGGFLKKPSINRLKVLSGLSSDPFDSYTFLKSLHSINKIQPLYFVLAARKNSIYDKNILPFKNEFKLMVNRLDGEICLHPSWGSNENIEILKAEKKLLEEICGHTISKSRQHYIKFNLPKTYSDLIKIGIKEEYSMGYGSINGFRASIATSYYWYDLKKEEKTNLLIHPFCFMDANSFYEQKLDVKTTTDELNHYIYICQKVNGKLITIFHNHFLGSDPMFNGWREMYEKIIAENFNSMFNA